MKRRIVAISVALIALASLVFAGSNGLPSLSYTQPEQREDRASISGNTPKRDYVEMKSDEGWQMEYQGAKIMVVVGNFAAHHNGTVITADSAVRYSERHLECFGNVLINRGSTYIYGDRAEYDGDTNEAKVYSKIVKVVDGNATLYTYNFMFNTKTNIGQYSGGGVLISGDNMLESDRGYVYSDEHEIICVERVQMRNNEYDMIGDSVVYNTDTDFAQFFHNTNIWNKNKEKSSEDDYLYADRGTFDKRKQLYTLTSNGYILTKDQELLCDSLDYYRDSNYVLLKRNIQIDDRTQKMLIFGDWGEYWKEPGNVFVTKNPSLISYDTTQGDTVFMRSDTMYVYTRYPIREKIEQARKDSLEQAAKMAQADSLSGEKADGKSENKTSATPKGSKQSSPANGKAQDSKGGANKSLDKGGLGGKTGGTAQGMTQDLGNKLGAGVVGDKIGGDSLSSSLNNPTKSDTTSVATDTIKVTKDSVAIVPKSKSELRREMIDSLIKDSINPQPKLLAKLLKEEATEVNNIVKAILKEEQRKREAERAAMLAERKTLFLKVLGEARIRDAEQRLIDKARAKEIKDSLKVVQDSIKHVQDSLQRIQDSIRRAEKRNKVDSVKIDSVKVDSIKLDSVKLDSIKLDSIRIDSVKVDSIRIDSVRLDSIRIDSVKLDSIRIDGVKLDSIVLDSAKLDALKIDSLKVDSLKIDSLKSDSLKIDSLKSDSLKMDSLAMDSLAKFDTMTVKQVKAYFKAIYDAEKAEAERIKQDSLNAKLDRIGLARQAKRTAQYRKWAIRDSIYMAKAQERADNILRRKLARMEKRGIFIQMADSATLAQVDSILLAEFGPLDTIVNHNLDSIIEILFPKPLPSPTEIAKADSLNIDSLYREIRAYSRVKLFRSDAQSVCDSLTMTTIDSIINMYKTPVLWNANNQITSDIMHIHTRNNQISQADFEGKPMMIAEIDTAHYNQVAGKEMTALFRNNQIYRNDVNSNVQTIYYMQEDNSPEVTLMAYIEAGDMTSYIENQQVVGITYRGNPVYTFYPMDKIPETQPTKLQGFKWCDSLRPSKDSVFNRIIRPSQRMEKRSLRKPLFPINALLQQRKANYLRRNEWRDRSDTLSYETIEWVESLKQY